MNYVKKVAICYRTKEQHIVRKGKKVTVETRVKTELMLLEKSIKKKSLFK